MASTMSVSMSVTGRTGAAAAAPARKQLSSVRARASVAPIRGAARTANAKVAGRKLVKVSAGYYDEYQETSYDPTRYQWPNPDFIAETIEKFPDEGVATIEEALVLFKEDNYVYLDIRSNLSRDSVGIVAGSVSVPWVTEKKRFEDGKMVINTEENPDWMAELKAKIPDTNTNIMVADLDGRTYAIDALETLFEEGYENVIGIKGGFKMWFKTFDNKLRRRVFGQYEENYSSGDQLGMGDSCGIHSSGAGFENQDRLSGDFWDNF